MTEIMPFPENNILFYWAAPQRRALIFYAIALLFLLAMMVSTSQRVKME